MKRKENSGTGFVGRIKGLGITLYQRKGQVVARVSTRHAPAKQSEKQFKARQQMKHSIALWNCFHAGEKPLMDTSDGVTAYSAFLRANATLPKVYLSKSDYACQAALLIPGMQVSSGKLPVVGYHFETLPEIGRVVVTDLPTGIDAGETRRLEAAYDRDLEFLLQANTQLKDKDTLLFYRFKQVVRNSVPQIDEACTRVMLDGKKRRNRGLDELELYSCRGFLALRADDEDGGWAVVLYNEREKSASAQRVLTTCELYDSYTTQEAFEAAAKSYRNVAETEYLVPKEQERK